MYKSITLKLVLLGLTLCCYSLAQAQQEEPDYSYKPLTVKLSEDGKKYVRFIIWHQQWLTTNNLTTPDGADAPKTTLTSSIRRSRMLAFAQISPRFLILTHFGLNGLAPGNLTSLGNNGNSPQLFLHDAWTEFMVSPELYVGTGLHYWKGMTRLANQSTLNFMTLDQSRPFVAWHSLGVTDQFARHLGVYAKGAIGKFDYRIAFNNPGLNGISGNFSEKDTGFTYTGASNPDSDGNPTGNTIIEGYFRYQLWDKESTKLPYAVGTYLGKKKVLGIGAGFFAHPNGMYNATTGEHEGVSHFALDAFLDMPVGDKGGCLNAYAAFQNFNYGDNYVARWAGTGTNLYAHVGYLIPGSKFMPYISTQSGSYEGLEDNTSALNVGMNYFVNGHHAKLTLEYHSISNDPREGGALDVNQLRLQAHIFL